MKISLCVCACVMVEVKSDEGYQLPTYMIHVIATPDGNALVAMMH